MARKPDISADDLYRQLPTEFGISDVEHLAGVGRTMSHRRINELMENEWVIRVDRGRYRKHRLEVIKDQAAQEIKTPAPAPDSPFPLPSELDGIVQQQEWEETLQDLQQRGEFKSRHWRMLVRFFQAGHIVNEAWEQLVDDGITTFDAEHGRLKRHPAALILKQFLDVYLTYGRELGMSIKSEQALEFPFEADEEDPLAKILGE